MRIIFTYILDVSRFSFLSLKHDTVSGESRASPPSPPPHKILPKAPSETDLC